MRAPFSLPTLSNGLCIGGTRAVHNTERDPFLSYRGGPAPLAGIRRCFLASFSPRGPFNSLHSAASLPSSPLASPLRQTRGTQSPTDSNHRLHLREEGRGGVGRGRRGGEEKSIQHQTMAYRPGGAVCRKVTAIHYVWGPANGQCACRQMDCKHLPCVSIAWVASGGAHTRANTKGAQARTHL